MSDIVEQDGLLGALRSASQPQMPNGEYLDTAQLTDAAAEEITRLRAALAERDRQLAGARIIIAQMLRPLAAFDGTNDQARAFLAAQEDG